MPIPNSSGVPCSSSFNVLSDEVVEMVGDNSKTDAVSHPEGKKPVKLSDDSLCR